MPRKRLLFLLVSTLIGCQDSSAPEKQGSPPVTTPQSKTTEDAKNSEATATGHANDRKTFVPTASNQENDDSQSIATVEQFMSLIGNDGSAALASLKKIETTWQPGYTAMIFELMPRVPSKGAAGMLFQLLQRKTGQKFESDIHRNYQWLWRQPYQPHPDYAKFKGRLHSTADKRFTEYFQDTASATIRLDEIMWGGVKRDGIPPLKAPKMLTADEADYLDDSNVVFGIKFGDDARAYPKRILAWHEMFKDTIGGESVCGVY